MALWTTYREIHYADAANEILSTFTDPHDRFHDQLNGIEWLLCRTPGVGRPRSKEHPSRYLIAVWKGDNSIGTYDIWVLYSYDDDCVQVHAVKVSKAI